jgi:hypothetical protein
MFKRRAQGQKARNSTEDLHTQFEELLDTVWRCERRAALQDRIDAQARFDSIRRARSDDRH